MEGDWLPVKREEWATALPTRPETGTVTALPVEEESV